MPHVVGAWELLEPLAAGRHTMVYRARPAGRQAVASADYAVKTSRTGQEAAARRFLVREARVAREVVHPHVVPIRASQLGGPRPCLVMPFLGHHTVGDMLASPGNLSLRQAIWIARQVAEGLAGLHARGWLHGDIKPDNVVLGEAGHATLTDLGFARRLGTPECGAGTPLLGTPNYASPERLEAETELTAQTDVFSLGVMLREMLEAIAGDGRSPDPSAGPSPPAQDAVRRQAHRLANRLADPDPRRRPEAVAARDQLIELELALFTARRLRPLPHARRNRLGPSSPRESTRTSPAQSLRAP